MKKRTIKALSAGIAAILCAGLVSGCNPTFDGGSGSGVTEITFMVGSGCMNTDTWLKPAMQRFSELKKNESYEEGKTGVSAAIMNDKELSYNSAMLQYDVLIGENKTNIYDMQAKGWLCDISDIVEKFDDKIDPSIKERIKMKSMFA